MTDRAAPTDFAYRPRPGWPPLAWVARCPDDGRVVEVRHGGRVECRDAWFCEAAWDGIFDRGGFDRTDVVFGSGGRRREHGVVFVSAGATTDRLHWLRSGDAVRVSNSLPALLASTGGEVDPTYGGWVADFQSVTRGLDGYVDTLSTTAGAVRLTYHRNLVWDGDVAREVEKPRPERAFDSFEAYRGFLRDAVGAVARNLSAPTREHPYRMLGTVSSGYDGAAVAALCREAGLEEAVTFREARLGLPDSGEEIGRALGLEVHAHDRDAWRRRPAPEPPFLAGSASGGEIYLKGAEARLGGRALMTGMWGDRVWGTKYRDRTGPLETGGPQGGLSLTEYRLWAGFLHCPVPALGALRREELVALTLSEEMAPWSVSDGYDRPIPRRICEEAGVPREALGDGKKYGAVILGAPEIFWSLPSLEDYLAWLRARRGAWLRRGKLPPAAVSALARPVQALFRRTLDAWEAATGLRPGEVWPAGELDYLSRREYLFKFMFPWALERAEKRYG